MSSSLFECDFSVSAITLFTGILFFYFYLLLCLSTMLTDARQATCRGLDGPWVLNATTVTTGPLSGSAFLYIQGHDPSSLQRNSSDQTVYSYTACWANHSYTERSIAPSNLLMDDWWTGMFAPALTFCALYYDVPVALYPPIGTREWLWSSLLLYYAFLWLRSESCLFSSSSSLACMLLHLFMLLFPVCMWLARSLGQAQGSRRSIAGVIPAQLCLSCFLGCLTDFTWC